MMFRIRATVFLLVAAASLLVFGPATALGYPLPYRFAHGVATTWCRFFAWWSRVMVGVDFVVEGRDKITDPACVYYSKHQSAWETLVFMTLFEPYVWILKREALWIPFFGWGLAGLKAIAINRKAGRSAIEQIKTQGRERLANGLGIMIFPEGTRVPPGQTKRFGLGGAILAQSANVPIVPIAHNSGSFWPARHWLVRRPGTVRIVVGEPVYPGGRSPEEVTADIKQWIDATVQVLEAEAIQGAPLIE